MTKPTQEHRTQAETRALIIQALTHTSPMTRTQIAKALARKKSPHLALLLTQLVQEGILQQDTITFHNGVVGYVYALSETFRKSLQKNPKQK